jgi:hypothetical protein
LWIKEYQDFKKSFEKVQGAINDKLKPMQDLAKERDLIKRQQEWGKKVYNDLLGVKNDPLNATLPSLQSESQPIFQALDKTAKFADKLLEKPQLEEDSKAQLSQVNKITTYNNLSSNSLYQTRKLINAMKKSTAQSTEKNKSAAQVFTEQSGVVMVEQLQAIGEKLDLLVDIEIYKIMRQNPDYYPKHEQFGKSQIDKAMTRYQVGEGAIKGIEVPSK